MEFCCGCWAYRFRSSFFSLSSNIISRANKLALNAPVSSRLRLSPAQATFMRDTDQRWPFNAYLPDGALRWRKGIENPREEWATKEESL